jgi:hypothetical protein
VDLAFGVDREGSVDGAEEEAPGSDLPQPTRKDAQARSEKIPGIMAGYLGKRINTF